MRTVMTSLVVLALLACNKPAETTTEDVAEENMAIDANAMDANATAIPAEFQLNETTWEFTRKGKAITESVYPDGGYIAWSQLAGGKFEYVDRGTAVMKENKACFTSEIDKEGEVCWTTQPTGIGQSMESISDKGEKLTVKRIAFVTAPTIPK